MIYSDLQEISIHSSTADIRLRFSLDVNPSEVAELSRILSIPVKKVNSPARTAVLLNSPPKLSSKTFPILSNQNLVFHVYHLPDGSIGILPIDRSIKHIALTWRGLLMFAFIIDVLKGAQTCFLHGAILKHKDNTVTILFGESGIGKSTTAKRYIECGGECICDDQMLLHLHPDNSLTVSALPTWSRINPLAPGSNETYDVLTEYKIKRFCRLTRDPSSEHLENDIKKLFQARLLKDIILHTYGMIPFFPENERSILGPHFMKFMDAIITQYPPKALYANLDAVLTNSIPLE